jgi:tetraacyldisaccharide 4'-kinase
MRVVDLRPRSVRLMSSLWKKGSPVQGLQSGPISKLNLAARLAARLADGFATRRVSGRPARGPVPAVVSVGNLALGGTGKTPVVAALSRDLAAAGWKGAVLTRGYGSPLSGPLKVEATNALAGDEARLMALSLSSVNWPVIQARRRIRGLDFLMEKFPDTQIVIVEDGHQTAYLGRHLDVVILDAWTVVPGEDGPVAGAITGPVVPFGPWRESAVGADRAGIWLLETEQDVPEVGAGGQAVAVFQRRLSLRSAGSGQEVEAPGCRPAVLSGIARPESFEKGLENVLKNEPVLAVRCGDHARYLPRRVAEITEYIQESKADFLVTTAKDWVKLEPFWPEDLAVLVADLEICWGRDKTLPELVGERLEALAGP